MPSPSSLQVSRPSLNVTTLWKPSQFSQWEVTLPPLSYPPHLSGAVIPERDDHILASVSPLSSPYFRMLHNYHPKHTSGPVSRLLIVIPQFSHEDIHKALHSQPHPGIMFLRQSLHTVNHSAVNRSQVCLLQGKDHVVLALAIQGSRPVPLCAPSHFNSLQSRSLLAYLLSASLLLKWTLSENPDLACFVLNYIPRM